MNIDASVLGQGRTINVASVESRLLTHAEILTLPTTPVAVISARPGVLHLPTWFNLLCLNNAAYTNLDAGASVIFDWSSGPIGSTGMTNALPFTAATYNATTGILTQAGFQDGLVFTGALLSRVGASVRISVANGALGDLTGGDSGNRWLATIAYQSFQVPRLLLA